MHRGVYIGSQKVSTRFVQCKPSCLKTYQNCVERYNQMVLAGSYCTISQLHFTFSRGPPNCATGFYTCAQQLQATANGQQAKHRYWSPLTLCMCGVKHSYWSPLTLCMCGVVLNTATGVH